MALLPTPARRYLSRPLRELAVELARPTTSRTVIPARRHAGRRRLREHAAAVPRLAELHGQCELQLRRAACARARRSRPTSLGTRPWSGFASTSVTLSNDERLPRRRELPEHDADPLAGGCRLVDQLRRQRLRCESRRRRDDVETRPRSGTSTSFTLAVRGRAGPRPRSRRAARCRDSGRCRASIRPSRYVTRFVATERIRRRGEVLRLRSASVPAPAP